MRTKPRLKAVKQALRERGYRPWHLGKMRANEVYQWLEDQHPAVRTDIMMLAAKLDGLERRYVVCKTVAAITLHLRELLPGEEPCYHGRERPNAQTLCGAAVGWDSRIPVGQERCSKCIRERKANNG